MEPLNLKFGGGLHHSLLHPAVLFALALVIIAIFVVKRSNVIVPVLLMILLCPLAQQVVIGGFHFLVLRIVILAAMLRVFVSRPSDPLERSLANGWISLDAVFILWVLFHVVTFLFLFSFQAGAIANRLGFVWDTLGGFFLLRFLIRDHADIIRAVGVLCFISCIIATGMVIEHFWMKNLFGVLGGVPRVPEIREGFVRAQGPFIHPLLAGTFGAVSLPLFGLLWITKKRLTAVLGASSSVVISALAGSSTPLLACAAGVIAICAWPIRRHMRLVRWGIIAGLLGLCLLMKAPIWFAITHVTLISGSSSYHRAELVNSFIQHFRDWWFIGTNSSGAWGWDMWDTANQYVYEGEWAGLGGLVCFLALIVISLSRIGRARRVVESEPERSSEWFLWFLGAAMFANIVGFFGISYFDQTEIAWFGLLSTIAAATAFPVLQKDNSSCPDVAVAGVETSLSAAECWEPKWRRPAENRFPNRIVNVKSRT